MKENLSNREEEILTEIININNIEALPGQEINRARYVQKLFSKYGVDAIIDLAGNVIGKIEGKSKNTIVINANLDFLQKSKNAVKLSGTELAGTGISSTALPLYILVMLSDILKDKTFNNSIYFLASSESETTQKGIKRFLEKSDNKILGMINLVGGSFGNISSYQQSVSRLKVEFKMETDVVSKSNPIFALANFIQKMREEGINEGVSYKILEISSGSTNKDYYDKAYFEIEVASNTAEELKTSIKVLKSIGVMVSKEEKILVEIKEEFIKEAKHLEKSKLEQIFQNTAEEMRIIVSKECMNSEIMTIQSKGIDAINIGIAVAGKFGTTEEYFEIKSIYKGIELLCEGIIKCDLELG